RDEGLIKLLSSGSMRTWRLTPGSLAGRVRLIARRHGLKPDWGKPTVRHCRGGAGNVSDGRPRTPLHRSKEWNVETLGLRLRAPVLYSTPTAAPDRSRLLVLSRGDVAPAGEFRC